LNNKENKKPSTPQTGKLRSQVIIICLVMPHLTAENRRVAPIPIMEVLIVWLVLNGMPKEEDRRIAKPKAKRAKQPVKAK
jgi:hypothetical protein